MINLLRSNGPYGVIYIRPIGYLLVIFHFIRLMDLEVIMGPFRVLKLVKAWDIWALIWP